MLKAGVGWASIADAERAGRTAAEGALREAGVSRPDLVLAFASGALDAHGFAAGVRAVVGDAPPIVGGSAIGVVTRGLLEYRGPSAAVAVLASSALRVRVAAADDLRGDEHAAGAALARALTREADTRLLLAFYDSIRAPAGPSSPPLLNSSAPLLAAIEGALGADLPIVGAGLLGGYDFTSSYQLTGRGVGAQCAVGCTLSGPFTPYIAVSHGCIPLDGVYRRITAMDRDLLHELDGRPVAEVLDEACGGPAWRDHRPLTAVTLGVNHGDRLGPPDEAAYVNRLVTGATPDGKSVGMFEPDLATGVEVQLMLRDNRAMFASTHDAARGLFERVATDGRRPALALYVDCGGRTALQSLTEREEAAIVQEVASAHGVPLLGFYSGVEIAPVKGRNRGLDWTGVLLVLAEDP